MKKLKETKKHVHGNALRILQKHELRQVDGGDDPVQGQSPSTTSGNNYINGPGRDVDGIGH